MENEPEVRKALEEDRLLFGTVDSWLIWNLTRDSGVERTEGTHVTDVTNASRTMLMNIETLSWDPFLLKYFDIPRRILPKIRSSSEIYGKIAEGPLAGIPISGCLGDQQAALVGQNCLLPGQAKCTYGTGCFLLYNVGQRPVYSGNGLLTTVAFQFGRNALPVYALEGSIAVAGAAIKWLREQMHLIGESEDVERLAAAVDDTGGVYFVPAFSGLFTPHWRPDARGIICGLTQFSERGHVVRAAFESVAFQAREILDCMEADSGILARLESLPVDGGMSSNDLLMQIQADLLGLEVTRPSMSETTALGAAIAGSLS